MGNNMPPTASELTNTYVYWRFLISSDVSPSGLLTSPTNPQQEDKTNSNQHNVWGWVLFSWFESECVFYKQETHWTCPQNVLSPCSPSFTRMLHLCSDTSIEIRAIDCWAVCLTNPVWINDKLYNKTRMWSLVSARGKTFTTSRSTRSINGWQRNKAGD